MIALERVGFNMYKQITMLLINQTFRSTTQELQCINRQTFHVHNITPIRWDLSRHFHQFQTKTNNLALLQKKSYRNSINTLPRNLWSNPIKQKKIPRLILLQNPWTWFMVKLDFSVLKNLWDPSFQEKEFKYGAKQAICRVTQVISEGQMTDLNGLLTRSARFSLLRELDLNWPEQRRPLLALKDDDVQISAPRKVYFIRIADKKYCDVDMAFLALKWAPINSVEVLIFTEILARFHREYTPSSIPEWTIAVFKIARFQILRHSRQYENKSK